ncbi:MAG TPA: SusD/RagB family nutrient-binding outer membrane lipoprotein [Chitinophagaceae bacterium]|nr:SusD/RagB family nutrient-binding outer membrane lipoprotein [Chitinophagaceae bacterium]
MKKILYISLLLLYTFSTGCKKFIDVNDDPNRPTQVQEALILSAVELAIAHRVVAGAEGLAPVLAQHYMQVVCLNQPVPNHGTYLLVNSELNGDWIAVYAKALNNLTILNQKAETSGNFNYAAIAKILSAFSLATATDWWGDVPYTEALKGSENFTPVYDNQQSIYAGIQTLLDNAIADIAKNTGKKPGSDDNFYEGDMEKWKRLAYTLKARYYMHLTKAPGTTPAAQADLALQALQQGMQSNDDDLKYSYPGGAGGEIQWYWTFDPVSTLVLSSAFVDTLKVRNDPRLSKMVAPAANTGLYNGRKIGTIDVGNLQDYSVPGDFYRDPAASCYILTYSEALFLKAEASYIKSGVAAAQPFYLEGIESHMTKLGLPLNKPDVINYIAARGTLLTANALQRIIEEKVIANFLSFENWNDWRRTGYPVLTKPANAQGEIPRKLLYPQLERASNPQPQQSSVLTDRVWWDKS